MGYLDQREYWLGLWKLDKGAVVVIDLKLAGGCMVGLLDVHESWVEREDKQCSPFFGRLNRQI